MFVVLLPMQAAITAYRGDEVNGKYSVKSKKTGTKNIDLKLCVGYVAQSRTRFERFLLAWPNRTLYAGQCRFCFDFTIVKCKKK